jgi:hypothetical protein
VLADPERYRTAYQAARSALEMLTWEEQARTLTALYERVAPPSPGHAVEGAQPCPDRQGGTLR